MEHDSRETEFAERLPKGLKQQVEDIFSKMQQWDGVAEVNP